MNVGMLWYDNDPALPLPAKITRAAKHYAGKYGQQPDTCYLHPSMLADLPVQVEGVTVKTSRSMLPHHFWIGVNQEI